MAYGRNAARVSTNQALQSQLDQQALQASLAQYIGTGTAGTFSASEPGKHGSPTGPSFSGQFPTGMTLADIGFTGQVVPDAGPILQGAFDSAAGFANSPEYLQRQQTIGSLMNAGPSFSADPALRERYFQQSISDPAMQQFNQEILPGVAARFGRGGNLGAANYAAAQAGGQLSGQLAGQRAGLLRDDEVRAQQALDVMYGRQAQGVNLSNQNQLTPISLLDRYGNQERDIRGAQNAQRLQEAYMNTPFGDPRLSLLGLFPGSSSVTPGQVGAPSASGGGGNGLLGMAGSLLSGYGGFMGDVYGGAAKGIGSLYGGLVNGIGDLVSSIF